ncbi:MAG: 50S ribosomal protein L11 methyltransferase [Imperialibacter sp.]|uniref:50S ribosomal protein L11 methyltransferase n=1 Tax=Imperialibacter sp. TaxID=2038411 RepID=UPI0032EC9B9E
MDFIELQIKTSRDLADILIAELGEIGFDTFQETDEGFNAYILEGSFKETDVKEIIQKYSFLGIASYETAKIPKENWNQSWETNYHPIEIPGRCRVRASFHKPDPSFPLEIVINPKMSFGTGHHSTTYLMMELLLDSDLQGKSVFDFGTGTGILAILAAKLGAVHIDASDIDEWCIENGIENIAINDCSNIKIQLGAVKEVKKNPSYDLVIANINRNVLLEEMPDYAAVLPEGSKLYLSGFYETDLPVIEEKAMSLGFRKTTHKVREAWVAAAFEKKAVE